MFVNKQSIRHFWKYINKSLSSYFRFLLCFTTCPLDLAHKDIGGYSLHSCASFSGYQNSIGIGPFFCGVNIRFLKDGQRPSEPVLCGPVRNPQMLIVTIKRVFFYFYNNSYSRCSLTLLSLHLDSQSHAITDRTADTGLES